MKVAVIGASGQLGSDVVDVLRENGDEVAPLTHSHIELQSLESVSECLTKVQPDVVINTAAMHHVENCEKDPAQAFAVNGLGARNLAVVSRKLGNALMHVSTDYVFDGSKGVPYLEEDAPSPLNVYGNSKLAGEYFIRAALDRHFIIRTSAVYGMRPCRAKGGMNFIDLMLKLARERGEVKVVNDETVTPTYARELARQMIVLCHSQLYGTYHSTAEGSCSWYDFADEIFRAARVDVSLKIASSNDFPAKVPRPKYSVLENGALKRNGLNIFTPWQSGLHNYLRSRDVVL